LDLGMDDIGNLVEDLKMDIQEEETDESVKGEKDMVFEEEETEEESNDSVESLLEELDSDDSEEFSGESTEKTELPEESEVEEPDVVDDVDNSGESIEAAIELSEASKEREPNVVDDAENPGESSFNPLIIYGGVGLGKTHLIQAIGNKIVSEQHSKKVVMVTSEKFTLDFVNSLRKNKTAEFANHYRNTDVLLIDDIQFFRGKEQTQEQFFHTFNAIHQSGKQIVMTADRYPGEMQGLQDRLISRFQSGLSVDVQPPDFEMRVAILMDKAEQNGVNLSYDVIEFIARHVKSNVRDLEGTIIRILARSSLMNQEIDFVLVREVVKERVGKTIVSDLTIEDVVRRVSEISNVPEKEIVGKSRKMEIVQARQVSMFLCRIVLGTSLNTIGVYFGGRDHTTVMHAVKTITKKQKNDNKIGKMVEKLKQELSFTLA